MAVCNPELFIGSQVADLELGPKSAELEMGARAIELMVCFQAPAFPDGALTWLGDHLTWDDEYVTWQI